MCERWNRHARSVVTRGRHPEIEKCDFRTHTGSSYIPKCPLWAAFGLSDELGIGRAGLHVSQPNRTKIVQESERDVRSVTTLLFQRHNIIWRRLAEEASEEIDFAGSAEWSCIQSDVPGLIRHGGSSVTQRHRNFWR